MDKSARSVHAHPISLFFYLSRFLYLLFIPFMRGLVATLSGGLIAWLSGAWVDVCIIVLIAVLAYLRWDKTLYCMDISGIFYTYGIFTQHTLFIPMQRICTLSTQQPFWLRPLQIVKLRIDTLALAPNRPDLILHIRKAEAKRILALRRSDPVGEKDVKVKYCSRIRDLFFLSLFTSNSLIGILFIVTFVSQAGKFLGQDLYNFLLTFFGQIARQVTIGLSPLATILSIVFQLSPITTAIALLLFFGWLLMFCMNLLQTKNLTVSRTDKSLLFSGGVLTRKEYSVWLSDISFIDVRQSLLTRVFHLYSVFLSGIGIGKEKSDISAIVPFSFKKRCIHQLASLLPEYPITERVLRPNAGAVMKFIIMPLWACLLVPAATLLSVHFLPMWNGILKFIGFMSSLPALWFLGVRLMDFFSSGVSKQNNYYTIRYSKQFYLHTVVFSYDKIAMINIRQSILQRGDKKCDFVISTRAERKTTHHVRNLAWNSVAELFDAQDLEPFILKPSWFDHCIAFLKSLETCLISKKKAASGSDFNKK